MVNGKKMNKIISGSGTRCIQVESDDTFLLYEKFTLRNIYSPFYVNSLCDNTYKYIFIPYT